ncbi:hypothetical protein ACN20G_05025 [Streptomyces sp. BI20]|uniref:hypothetical protein n=1 Tax=Streptomyces sp. BI20 TaxID=3403460 RepID=UPI003C70BDB5
MPETLPSRRSLLVGAAGAAGVALLSGCTSGPEEARRAAERAGVLADLRVRRTAAEASRALLARYEATAAAHPALTARLAPLRATVAAHLAALEEPAGVSASPSPARGAAGADGAPSGAAPAPVAARPEQAVRELAAAERRLAEDRLVALGQAPGEPARLLASLAAAGLVHQHLLTAGPDSPTPKDGA